jgi:RNA polymerase sigma factor (sigma-70 family)
MTRDEPDPATRPAPDGPAPLADWTLRSRELAALLARAGVGDRAAFARLYDLTSDHLFAVVLRIERDRAAAEDVLQEVYVAAWKAAAGYDAARSQPMTWLTQLARNRAIDSLRRQQARPDQTNLYAAGPDDDAPDPANAIADDAPGPLALLGLAVERRELTRCIAGLTPQQRQSVALAFFDGLSHAEVAAQLQQPLGTVKSWVRRALATLKACLDHAVLRDSAR